MLRQGALAGQKARQSVGRDAHSARVPVRVGGEIERFARPGGRPQIGQGVEDRNSRRGEALDQLRKRRVRNRERPSPVLSGGLCDSSEPDERFGVDLGLGRDGKEDELDAPRRELLAELDESRYGIGLWGVVAFAEGPASRELARCEEAVSGEVVELRAKVEPALAADENLAVAVAQSPRKRRLCRRAQHGRNSRVASEAVFERQQTGLELAIGGQSAVAFPDPEKSARRRYLCPAREGRRFAAPGSRGLDPRADCDCRQQSDREHPAAGARNPCGRDLGERLGFTGRLLIGKAHPMGAQKM